MTGTVVFSLDFELGWGHADVRPEYVDLLRTKSNPRFDRIRSLIDLFDKYEIPATWAVVGKLIESGDDSLFHNPRLFEYLLDAQVDHDIGLHSYRHLNFSNISKNEAENDLRSGVDSLSNWDINPKSFIYPRGYINHTELLPEYGFECYRTKSSNSKFQSFFQEILPPVISNPSNNNSLCSISATQYLAARRPSKLIRINMRRSLNRAVKNNGMVHFWLHPHNIYSQPDLFSIIKEGMGIISQYSDSGDLYCKTMSDLV
jgi:hypothetical protein